MQVKNTIYLWSNTIFQAAYKKINDWQPHSNINIIEIGTQKLIQGNPVNFILHNMTFYDK